MDLRDSPRRGAVRPASPAQSATSYTQAQGVAPVTHVPAQNRSSNKKWLVPVLIALVLVAAGFIAWRLFAGASDAPKTDRYQAVFLDTGQIYFGHLKNVDGDYLTLEQTYYTKSTELPADATPEQKQATANNVSLVRVGDEVYGPENTMKIRADQVLFWQDLKADSKVAKAIDSAK